MNTTQAVLDNAAVVARRKATDLAARLEELNLRVGEVRASLQTLEDLKAACEAGLVDFMAEAERAESAAMRGPFPYIVECWSQTAKWTIPAQSSEEGRRVAREVRAEGSECRLVEVGR